MLIRWSSPVLLTLFFAAHMTSAQTSDSATSAKPSPDASAKDAGAKPKKVWTNDDMSSAATSDSLANKSSLGAGKGAPSPAASDGAVFVSPRNGTIVRPGELLHIEVSITPGKVVDGPIGMVSEVGVSNEICESPPYSFTMTVSREQTVGAGSPLIGKHFITASGRTKGQDGWGLAAVEVDVEEDDMPRQLSIFSSSGMMSQHGPPSLRFYGAGKQQRLVVTGKFPNGDQFDVVNSTFLTLASENPRVVAVAPEGMITSSGPGDTSITATYRLGGQTMQASIPVSVTVSTSGLIPNPLSLDFGDQPAGTASQPLQVILTNRFRSTITIYKLEIRAAVRETDNCTSAPLAPGDSCTISVIYVPYRAGPGHGIIYIPNSLTGMVTIPIFGNGT